ncbi:hypothetical protein [Pseudomonas fluorescens]|uniref:hypothetical protein n=1 Tax=Pseudomonas fluorescens TaxID=294 RepID=UPI00177F2A8E|nr:hypothetical protein [Pseudomonas fluorescens]
MAIFEDTFEDLPLDEDIDKLVLQREGFYLILPADARHHVERASDATGNKIVGRSGSHSLEYRTFSFHAPTKEPGKRMQRLSASITSNSRDSAKIEAWTVDGERHEKKFTGTIDYEFAPLSSGISRIKVTVPVDAEEPSDYWLQSVKTEYED